MILDPFMLLDSDHLNLVDGFLVSVEQHAEALLENYVCFLIGQVFSPLLPNQCWAEVHRESSRVVVCLQLHSEEICHTHKFLTCVFAHSTDDIDGPKWVLLASPLILNRCQVVVVVTSVQESGTIVGDLVVFSFLAQLLHDLLEI